MSTGAAREGGYDTDLAVRILLPAPLAEVAGAVLMESLGAYVEEPGPAGTVALVFYPDPGSTPSDAELLALLPEELLAQGLVRVEREAVSRDWVDGWKDHFHPIIIGRVRVRPPWEPALAGDELVDVVINPGLAFGTGLHATTGGTLALLQEDFSARPGQAAQAPAGSRGALVDVGTGSGILSIAAAKLGWGPIVAFDNDAVALVSTHENIAANGVGGAVQVVECGVEEAPLSWFEGATVVANMTLDPLSALVRRLADVHPSRMAVAGLLAGAQERQFVVEAERCGFVVGRRLYEMEWVSLELLPAGTAATGPASEG